MTVALVMSRQAVESAQFHISKHEGYLEKIAANNLESVKHDINTNIEVQKDMMAYAEVFCSENTCTKEQEEYLQGNIRLVDFLSR